MSRRKKVVWPLPFSISYTGITKKPPTSKKLQFVCMRHVIFLTYKHILLFKVTCLRTEVQITKLKEQLKDLRKISQVYYVVFLLYYRHLLFVKASLEKMLLLTSQQNKPDKMARDALLEATLFGFLLCLPANILVQYLL